MRSEEKWYSEPIPEFNKLYELLGAIKDFEKRVLAKNKNVKITDFWIDHLDHEFGCKYTYELPHDPLKMEELRKAIRKTNDEKLRLAWQLAEAKEKLTKLEEQYDKKST